MVSVHLTAEFVDGHLGENPVKKKLHRYSQKILRSQSPAREQVVNPALTDLAVHGLVAAPPF